MLPPSPPPHHSSPAEAEQPLAVFPPLAWPVAHPSASPFLPPLLRAVAGQPLPRDVKAAFTLTAMARGAAKGPPPPALCRQ